MTQVAKVQQPRQPQKIEATTKDQHQQPGAPGQVTKGN